MTTELIIFSAILVVSVIAHFFFWRDSKRRYTEYIEQAEALNEKLKRLEANDAEIDRMLDDADADMQKIGDEIDALCSVWFVHKKRTNQDN